MQDSRHRWNGDDLTVSNGQSEVKDTSCCPFCNSMRKRDHQIFFGVFSDSSKCLPQSCFVWQGLSRFAALVGAERKLPALENCFEGSMSVIVVGKETRFLERNLIWGEHPIAPHGSPTYNLQPLSRDRCDVCCGCRQRLAHPPEMPGRQVANA